MFSKKHSYNIVFPLRRLVEIGDKHKIINEIRFRTVSILGSRVIYYGKQRSLHVVDETRPKLHVLKVLSENGERLQAYEKIDSQYKHRKLEVTLTIFLSLTMISPFYLAQSIFCSCMMIHKKTDKVTMVC